MTCQHVIAALMDYLSQTQHPAARQAVDEHLASCAHCARFVVSYRATPGIVRRATAGLDRSEGSRAQPSPNWSATNAVKGQSNTRLRSE